MLGSAYIKLTILRLCHFFRTGCLEWDPEKRMGPKEASRHPWIVGEEVANAMMASPLVMTPRGSQTDQDLADAARDQLNLSGSTNSASVSTHNANGGASSSGAPVASAAMSRVLPLASDDSAMPSRLRQPNGGSPSVGAPTRGSPASAAVTASASAGTPPAPSGPAPAAPAPAPTATHSRLGFFLRHKFGTSNSPSTA